MRKRGLTIPEIMAIAGTRAALGAGVGLLLAEKFKDGQRKRAAWVLVAVGALSTVPILVRIFRKPGLVEESDAWHGVAV